MTSTESGTINHKISDGEPFTGGPGAPHRPLLQRVHRVRGQEVFRALLNAGDKAVPRVGSVNFVGGYATQGQQGQEQGRSRRRALSLNGSRDCNRAVVKMSF